MRERMVQHRANPVCASCHAVMDPLGLALENFDAVGRWRIAARPARRSTRPACCPTARTFEGVDGLRGRRCWTVRMCSSRTLTEKLLTYALGRGLEHYDAPAVRAIARTRPEDYRFSALILGIVNSTPFQMRRTRT